jgi:hypothetical protein
VGTAAAVGAATPAAVLSYLPDGCVPYEDCNGVIYEPRYEDTYQGTMIVYVAQ